MLIDEKGRLFGKLNVLDVLFAMILLAAIFLGYTMLSRGGSETIPVTYTVEIQNRKDDYFEHVHIGESVIDGVTKSPVGSIVGFSKQPARKLEQADGKMHIYMPQDHSDGYVKIQADAIVAYPDLLVGNEPMKIGKEVALRSESLAMHGYVTGIEYDSELLKGAK